MSEDAHGNDRQAEYDMKFLRKLVQWKNLLATYEQGGSEYLVEQMKCDIEQFVIEEITGGHLLDLDLCVIREEMPQGLRFLIEREIDQYRTMPRLSLA